MLTYSRIRKFTSSLSMVRESTGREHRERGVTDGKRKKEKRDSKSREQERGEREKVKEEQTTKAKLLTKQKTVDNRIAIRLENRDLSNGADDRFVVLCALRQAGAMTQRYKPRSQV